MCALLIMAVFDTEENQRTDLTRQTIESLIHTVDFRKHRLIISDNGSCEATQALYRHYIGKYHEAPQLLSFSIIYNGTNLGTAEAVNKGISRRKPGEHVIKLDNDVVIHQAGWVDLMEECITREPLIGVIGLKRKDLEQTPWNKDWRSELIMLPHERGQKWLCVERSADVMGTCTMFSSALLDIVGYSYQPGIYGFEDNLMCHRSHLAGFYNCFLNYIEIDHIDPGQTPYQKWKEDVSGAKWKEYDKVLAEMKAGTRSIYYKPENL